MPLRWAGKYSPAPRERQRQQLYKRTHSGGRIYLEGKRQNLAGRESLNLDAARLLGEFRSRHGRIAAGGNAADGRQTAGGEVEFVEQFGSVAVFDEAVGQAKADDIGPAEARGVGLFEHGAAEAAG